MSKANIFRALTSFSPKEVKALFNQSSIVHHSSYCVIRRQPTTLSGKILIAIPKSVGCAPYRNRYKRRIKHIFFEHHFFNTNARWGIFIKKNAIMPSYQTLKELMITLMSKA